MIGAKTAHRHVARPRPRGFTLVEMIVALASSTTLVVAGMSVLLISVRGMPERSDDAVGAAEAMSLMNAIAMDAAECIAVEVDAAISFTVPDRTGAGSEDTVVYTVIREDGVDYIMRESAAGTVSRAASMVTLESIAVIDDGDVPRLEIVVTVGAVPALSFSQTVPMHNAAYAHSIAGGG